MSFHELTFACNEYFNSLGIEFMPILQQTWEPLKQAPWVAYWYHDAHRRNLDSFLTDHKCRASDYQQKGLL